MQVLKFGGTSVGTPQRIQQVARLIDDGHSKIVVLSAVAGTTNKLAELSGYLRKGELDGAFSVLAGLKSEYARFIKELFRSPEERLQGEAVLERHFTALENLFWQPFTAVEEKIALAQGELIATHLFQIFLQNRNKSSVLLPALEFMRTNDNGEPDMDYLHDRLTDFLGRYHDVDYYITQGYICRNAKGEIDNLKRGGSDYTATLIGAALEVREIQIWTDIDGLHNNDPRVVDRTFPIRCLSYREAAELAYFGAKILHPTCIVPAEQKNVPVRLKNTFEPEAEGTLISRTSSGEAITALAAKDGIIAIKIRSGRMLNAYGFLRKVFEIFEQYKTPIDMITTSEVAVSLTIDDATYLEEILHDLRAFGEVSCDTDQTIICIVGDSLSSRKGYAKNIFSALSEIPIRMVSYGGSDNNISILVHRQHKEEALQALNRQLFPRLTSQLVGSSR